MNRLARIVARPVTTWTVFPAVALLIGWLLGGAIARWLGHLGMAPWGVVLALAPLAIALGWAFGRGARAARDWARRRLLEDWNRRQWDALADLRTRLGAELPVEAERSPLARYLRTGGEHGKDADR